MRSVRFWAIFSLLLSTALWSAVVFLGDRGIVLKLPPKENMNLHPKEVLVVPKDSRLLYFNTDILGDIDEVYEEFETIPLVTVEIKDFPPVEKLIEMTKDIKKRKNVKFDIYRALGDPFSVFETLAEYVRFGKAYRVVFLNFDEIVVKPKASRKLKAGCFGIEYKEGKGFCIPKGSKGVYLNQFFKPDSDFEVLDVYSLTDFSKSVERLIRTARRKGFEPCGLTIVAKYVFNGEYHVVAVYESSKGLSCYSDVFFGVIQESLEEALESTETTRNITVPSPVGTLNINPKEIKDLFEEVNKVLEEAHEETSSKESTESSSNR